MPKLPVELIIDLVIIAALFFGGFWWGGHTTSMADKVIADKIYQAQVEANQAEQTKLNDKSQKVETELAAERLKSADLNKKWREARAKTHTKCTLDSATIGVLRDAAGSK